MKELVKISPQCLAFTEYLFKNVKRDIVHQNHPAESADLQDLQRWRITPAEWEMAFKAASLAHSSGRSPGEALDSAAGIGILDKLGPLPGKTPGYLDGRRK